MQIFISLNTTVKTCLSTEIVFDFNLRIAVFIEILYRFLKLK